MSLKIAQGLSLPVDAVTQTFAILAKRGTGKTYTASVMAEEMLKAGHQVVAIDPTGAWFGLRSSADGKRGGFPIVVMGGEHGDVPLEDTAGEVIASAIVENRLSAVIDLSLFRKGQLIRFMVAFAETLYRLNRDALHLFVDEADAVAPQGRQYGGDENRMLGAMEDIVRRGRRRGIGCTLITQRPAVLNKNVLTQCESLYAMRLVHPKDIDAIMEWINVHADDKDARAVVDSLPTLGIGEAWFWSPGWMQTIKRVKIRERETFDSSATPKPGQTARVPKALAEIDLNALGAQIKATVEKAKANDPKVLQARIRELEKSKAPAAVADQGAIDRAVAKAEAARDKHWQGELSRLKKDRDGLAGKLGQIERIAHLNGQATFDVTAPPATVHRSVHKIEQNRQPVAQRQPVQRVAALRQPSSVDGLGKGETAILTAIAQHQDGVTRDQLTVLTGYKRSSRDTYLQRLRTAGLIEDGQIITATDAGIAALGSDFEPLPTGQDLQTYWLNRLSGGEKSILEILIDQHPATVDRESLTEATGYQRSSRDTYLQRLKSRKLVVDEGRGMVRASDQLF